MTDPLLPQGILEMVSYPIVIVLALASVACSDQGGNSSLSNGPSASVGVDFSKLFVGGPEWNYDFDEIRSSDQLTREVVLTNATQSMVRLSKIEETCSCQVSFCDKRWLGPGESALATLTAKTGHTNIGPFSASFQVYGEDRSGNRGLAGIINFRANVSPSNQLTLWPATLDFDIGTQNAVGQSSSVSFNVDLILTGPWDDANATSVKAYYDLRKGIGVAIEQDGDPIRVDPKVVRWPCTVTLSEVGISRPEHSPSMDVIVRARCGDQEVDGRLVVANKTSEELHQIFVGRIVSSRWVPLFLPRAVAFDVSSQGALINDVDFRTSADGQLEMRCNKLVTEGTIFDIRVSAARNERSFNISLTGLLCES